MRSLFGFLLWLAAAFGLRPKRADGHGWREAKRSPKRRFREKLEAGRKWALVAANDLVELAEVAAITGDSVDDFYPYLAQMEAIAFLWAPRRAVAMIKAAQGPPKDVAECITRACRAYDILCGPRTKRLFSFWPRLRMRRRRRFASIWRIVALLFARMPATHALELSG